MIFVDENSNIITEAKLLEYFTEHQAEISNDSGAENFGQYLSNCTGKNGNLSVCGDCIIHTTDGNLWHYIGYEDGFYKVSVIDNDDGDLTDTAITQYLTDEELIGATIF